MTIPTPEEMLKAGVHFGHQKKHWHPGMKMFIHSTYSNVHVLDLFKTEKKLVEAMEFLRSVAAKGQRIIFVGTKPQCKEAIEVAAKESGALYVTERWFGGTLTNFNGIKKNRDKLIELKKKLEERFSEDLTKKERLLISREIEKLEKNYGGLIGLSSLPGAVYIVDARREKTSVSECNKTGVSVVALTDTNTDPSNIDYVIPGNDDAIGSIFLITKVIAEAVLEGYKVFGTDSSGETVSVVKKEKESSKATVKTKKRKVEKTKGLKKEKLEKIKNEKGKAEPAKKQSKKVPTKKTSIVKAKAKEQDNAKKRKSKAA